MRTFIRSVGFNSISSLLVLRVNKVSIECTAINRRIPIIELNSHVSDRKPCIYTLNNKKSSYIIIIWTHRRCSGNLWIQTGNLQHKLLNIQILLKQTQIGTFIL